MCGLFGIINFNKTSKPIELEALKKGANALKHRGPDGEGFFLNKNRTIGLAHRRLSIIDLETGNQPLQTHDGQITAIVNGEFYDFEKIRYDLQQKGHVFKTNSDSEIVLHLYREYGLSFTDYLRGEFAFILYDALEEKLIAVRDRFGVKPFVYKIDEKNGCLYCASEAKAILAQDDSDAHWDMDAFYQASQMQYLPANKTLFNGIYQLEPGQMIIWEKGNIPSLRFYWDMDYPEIDQKTDISFNEAVRLVREKLDEAVSLRMRSDVGVCYHLSGGIDSSSISALAASKSKQPIDCFTVRFEDKKNEGYDEYNIAKEQAALIGAKLHEVSVSKQDMVDHIDDAVFKTEGLAINGHLVGKYLLNKAIRANGFKVSLSGEGSDEIFAGYPHFKQDLISNDKQFKHSLYADNEKLKGVFLSSGDELDTSRVFDILGNIPSFLKAKASLGYRLNALLKTNYTSLYNRDAYYDFIQAYNDRTQFSARDRIDLAAYLWSKSALANYILKTLGDGCEMAHSIEGRVPFLDHKLFETVKTLPLSYKLKQMPDGRFTEKHILREAMKPYLTNTLYKRQKHPFIAPPVSTSDDNSYLFEKLGDLINSETFKSQPFWDQSKIQNWFEGITKADLKTKITQEPVLMMVLTSLSAARQFNLTIGRDNDANITKPTNRMVA